MISSSQIKAARAMLGWSALKLAEFSGIGPATIRRYELQQGIPSANTNVLQKIKTAIELAGIQFTGDPLINPGVTLDLSKREAALDRE